jgi:signal transduction histidine kinase
VTARLRGDAQQLALLVGNLVDSAIRYTPESGSVRVDVFCEESDVVLRVTDNGIGIPLQAPARIFERFYRVENARSRERGGTGWGLSIVKHIVELHGGHISLHSELGGRLRVHRAPADDGPVGQGARPSQ